MLSWDDFDSEDTTTAPATKAAAQPSAPLTDSPVMENIA